MKKIINNPQTVVSEMCSGIAMTNPDVVFHHKYNVLVKKKLNPNKVSLVSGGGSGHEPAHAGYVGQGMLDAAVCGDVFASPSQIQVYQALRIVNSNKGILMIVKNYSGDMMNFKNAAALAKEDGIEVDYVKVEDDIAVQDSLYTVGRRGVAGTVFVHKVAGAAAEEGHDLKAVKEIAQRAADSVRSLGFAYSSCTVPAKGSPTFKLGEQEMEYGVGIHGEPGICRCELVSADEMAGRMIPSLLDSLEMGPEQDIALLVNGFGGTPLMELYVFANSLLKCLSGKKITVYRSFVGNYMTSIDMAGASVSVMKLDETLKKYLDKPSFAPGFPVFGPIPRIFYEELETGENKEVPECFEIKESWKFIDRNELSLNNIKYMVAVMGACILENEVAFCELDSFAGDGDFGMSVAKGFFQLEREWNEIIEKDSLTIGEFLKACSLVIMEYCGGASGPIWGSAFRSAGIEAGEKTSLSLKDFALMMQSAVTGIQKTGERSFGRGAIVGDKTLIDALVPCADTLINCADSDISVGDALKLAAKAAVRGADDTKNIVARMGRAGVVGERSLGHPDAGAFALGVVFTKIADEF